MKNPLPAALTIIASLGIIFLYWQVNTPLGFPAYNTPGIWYVIIPTVLAVMIFVGAMTTLKKHQWLLAALLLIIVTPLALAGFLPNGKWGISDWDYYFSYHTAVRRLFLTQGEVPQWNPYICGGTSAIGDPEFPLFTPTFLLELLFDIPTGFRFAIFFSTITGALGMLALSYRLRLSAIAGLIAALAYAFGSVNLLEIVEGHPNIFSAMWVPWILWSWGSAYQTKKIDAAATDSQWPAIQSLSPGWIIACGIFLALTFLQGGIYMLMYVTLSFLLLIITLPNRRRSILITTIAGLLALGLAAIKLLPVLLWLQQFQDKAYASSAATLTYLHHILLGRYLHGVEDVITNQGSGWHEYGAYIGPIVIILALIGLLQWRHRPVVRLLLLATLLATLLSATGPTLKPLFDQAPFLPRSNISRLILFAVLPLTLLAGIGYDRLRQIISRRFLLISFTTALMGLLSFDLFSLAYELSRQAFVLIPAPHISEPNHPITYTIDTHTTRHDGVDYTRAYARARAGYGTMSYCTVLGPSPSVRVAEDPEGSPYVSLSDPEATATLQSWQPRRIAITVSAPQTTDLILNSNYAEGWSVHDETTNQTLTAREISGRLSVNVPTGTHHLVFEYQAPGYQVGRTVTTLTLILLVLYLILYYRRSTTK